MTRHVAVDQLVGTAEIAERLGLSSYAVVNSWVRRYPDFPDPLCIVSGVKVWHWPDVARWASGTGRNPPTVGIRTAQGVGKPSSSHIDAEVLDKS